MISRKRIFGIILFVVASLITFAFANPASPEDKAPSINVDPGTVGIVQGSNYDVMKGVTVTDDNDELTAVADITDTTGLSIGDHTITYTATDSSDNTATAKRTMNVLNPKEDADGDGYTNGEEVLAETDFLDVNSHPSYARSSTITLNVNNVYTMEVHGVIPVFRATANDVADGNVAVIISNNINANVVDTYTVTFRATDSLGNLVTITREFNVVDTTKPVITLNGLASYKVVLGQTTYTDDLAIVTDNYDATLTISGVINGNPLIVGVYTLDYNFTDANLNVADKVVRTINVLDPLADEDHDGYTNGEEVIANTDFNDETSMPTYDKTPIITVEAYNLNPTNQDITVNVTTNEGVLNFASHTFTENGSFDFLAVDVLGNTTTKKVTITNIDKKSPVITIGAYITVPTNQDILVSANTDEGTLNFISHLFTTNDSFEFVATDAAGNVTTKTVTITNIDKIAPESPTLVSPLDGASIKGTSVINTWTVVSDAVKYIYESYNDAAATSLRWNQTIMAPSHSKVATNVADATFWWRVKAVDAVGNESPWSGLRKIVVDTTKPIITITNYITTPTNQDILVSANTDEGTLNFISHLFTENGSFEFVATDEAGNVSNKTVKITNIDKVAPTATISYDKITWTNTNVIATLVPSEDVTVTNNGGLSTYTFTDNGTFTFNFVDAAGNTGSVLAIVNYIDKTLPEIIVKAESIGNAPYFNIVHFKLHDDNLKEAVLNGIVIDKSSGPWGDMNDVTIGSYYTVIEGKNILVLRDKAGNEVTYEFYLDVTKPVITINPYIKTKTNQDITVYAITNEGTLKVNSHKFTKNGIFKFIATDLAGNVSNKTVKITNIDKVAPTATISYDKITWTNTNVIATLVPSEDVTVTNNGGLSTYTFTDNGTFTFNFVDAAGNTGSVLAIVNYIDKTLPEIIVKAESIGNAPYFNIVHFKLHDDNLKEAVLNGIVIDKSNGPWGDMNDVTIGSYYTVIEGKNILVLRDKAGNTVTYEFYLDVTAPVVRVLEKGNEITSGSYVDKRVQVQINAVDANIGKVYINGVEYPQYNGAGWYDIDWILRNSTTETNKIVLEDKAGNKSDEFIMKLDLTAPRLRIFTGGQYYEETGLMFNTKELSAVIEDTHIGKFYIDGVEYPQYNGSGWFGLSWALSEGTHTFKSVDKYGNYTELSFEIDLTKPVVRVLEKGIEITSGSYVDKTGQVSINAVDKNIGKVYINGVEYTQYNGAGWYDIDWILRNSTTETNKIVLEDKAGNKSDEFIMKLDLTAPRLRIFTGGQYYEGTGLIFDTKELSAVIEDTHIGKFYIDGVEYTGYEGAGWFGLSWALSKGTHIFKSVDKYGNTSELSFEIVIISLTFDKTTNLSSSQASNTWYTDRYSPASFTNVSFDGENRLKESISSTASAANRPSSYGSAFYNTQGRIYDTPNATIISADLYVSSSWATTNKRMAGLWGTGFDLSNNISSYPIIEFTSDSNTPRFRAYNVIDGTWIDLGLPTGFQYDKWYSVSIEVTASNTIIYKVGDITYTFGDANGTTKIGNVILQGHNTNDGVDYDIYWDNFIAR